MAGMGLNVQKDIMGKVIHISFGFCLVVAGCAGFRLDEGGGMYEKMIWC